MLTTAPHLYIRRPSPTTAEFSVTTCPPLTLPLRLALLGVLLLRVAAVFFVLLALYTQYGDVDTIATTTITTSSSNIALDATPITATTTILSLPSTSTTTTSYAPHPLLDALLPSPIPQAMYAALAALVASGLGQSVARVAALLPAWALVALSVLLLYTSLQTRIHTTESVLVLRGLGIQTSSSSSSSGWDGGGGGLCWSFFSYLSRLLGFGGGNYSVTEGGGGKNDGIPACLAMGKGGRYGGGGAAGGGGSRTRFIPTAQIQDLLINEAFRGFEVVYYLVVVVEGEEDVVVVFPKLLPRRRIVEAVWRGVRGCLYEQGDAAAAAAGREKDRVDGFRESWGDGGGGYGGAKG